MTPTETLPRTGLSVFAAPAAGPSALRNLPGVHVREVASLEGLPIEEVPAVLILSSDLLPAGAAAALARLPEHVIVLAADAEAREAADEADRLFLSLEDVTREDGAYAMVASAARLSAAVLGQTGARRQLEGLRSELRELNRIGMALGSERDPDRLLGLILTQARRLTTSDAGSLYLVVQDEAGTEQLHFLRAQNDSLPDLPDPDFTLPLDRSSIAGYAASTGEPLILDDVYDLPEEAPYKFNRGFDREHGYRAKSMLVVPMNDHKGRVVGVLQLINRKRHPEAVIRTDEDSDLHVLPYTAREVEIVASLAGQAAVSIENGRLYRDIENLFKGFIEAAVTAIDQRDPTTSGHSLRVTEMTCGLAEAVNAAGGTFQGVHFDREEMKQLRYAGLLHDFGKVGVREEVLVKEKKLPPVMWERIGGRFALIRRTLEAHFERDRVAYLETRGREGYDAWLTERSARLDDELARVDFYFSVVRDSNEPRVLPEDGAAALHEIQEASVLDLEGQPIPFLLPEEATYLRIRRGSLSEAEFKQIQSHVVHSYNFLQEIPWTEELSRIDEIVRGHHEKLNGRGYPDGIAGEQICLETRMMTVADIFDALTASDRPYKKAMPVERALAILRMEAEAGELDGALVQLFIESKVYEKVLDKTVAELRRAPKG